LLEDPDTTNFFFTRRPPGIQIRFETTPDRSGALETELYARLNALRPMVELVVPGVYEPEERLFGGPSSMPYVHRLFTLDSRAWLAFHRSSPGIPAWVFSLVLLRHLVEGIGEDTNLWNRIARQTGRAEGKSASVRAAWSNPTQLEASLPRPVAALATEWGAWLRAAGRDWLTGHFGDKDATEALAYWTLTHWNRGGIPVPTQAVLATALANGRS
jgi:thiopeptide-type bacteriocin biosynthesis protein